MAKKLPLRKGKSAIMESAEDTLLTLGMILVMGWWVTYRTFRYLFRKED